MEILRKYCLNDNPVKLQVLSDQAANFPTKCARRRAHPPYPTASSGPRIAATGAVPQRA